jgi:UPF0755 protein
MRRRRRRADLLRVSSRLLLVLALALLVTAAVWAVSVPVGPGSPQLVTVARGESVVDVAHKLGKERLVRVPSALVVTAYVTGKWRRIQMGRHELAPNMNVLEILDALCRGDRRPWRWLTIPEGYTLGQVAHKVEEDGLGSAARFLEDAAQPERLPAGFAPAGANLEGYLFPDTYRVDANQDESDIIAQMIRRFDQVVWAGLFERQPSYGGRSLHDIITLASLVEAEAKRDGERPTIAGVLMNRLRQGRPLECDATVQYALGDGRKPRLSHEDLKIESEYNTYLHVGLPPGPICSPGEASIRAAMTPADVPYLYYVARADGSHIFSRSFEQHEAAIARIRKAQ